MSDELKRALAAAGLNQVTAEEVGFELADGCDQANCESSCTGNCGSKCQAGCAPGHQGGGS